MTIYLEKVRDVLGGKRKAQPWDSESVLDAFCFRPSTILLRSVLRKLEERGIIGQFGKLPRRWLEDDRAISAIKKSMSVAIEKKAKAARSRKERVIAGLSKHQRRVLGL